MRNFSSFLLSFLSGACISSRLSVFEVHRICSQTIWLKSEINLLLSNFHQSCLNILDFTTGIFEKKYFKKINCRRWSENVDVTFPDSISLKELEFEKMLSVNVEVLEILVGRSIWGNKKLELSVSIKLLVESESSYFNKSILKLPN